MADQIPLPVADGDSQPFWEGVARRELLIQRCDACQRYVFYPRSHCPHCFGDSLSWVQATGAGTIYSYAGYTDSTGRKYINYRLSQARAAAVRFYLARKGVPPARMIAKGYGASGYVAPNSTAAGRAQNRRVELHQLP